MPRIVHKGSCFTLCMHKITQFFSAEDNKSTQGRPQSRPYLHMHEHLKCNKGPMLKLNKRRTFEQMSCYLHQKADTSSAETSSPLHRGIFSEGTL